MYKGTYNENGEYTGFYVEGIHENIPQPNIELTEEEWQQALSKNYKVVSGKHTYSVFIEKQDNILENLRTSRNTLLTESDWTQLDDSPLDEEKKAEWKIYRQALRDLTDLDDLTSIIWPKQPL
ncbi:phage tail assembly chaperone [Flavobacterium defluvii]|uniref:Phage tail assembly chaperone protein n=1 Tax=Flavobacterium defluvii TaxID=370979 RepID=A0A1M5RLS2_9FLAO|nr:phage tail assembly chaperone [Flavobacterium defluvii]SHH27272.1 Phage tail assembly chaperone protein [Flavobacterium defluvii]